MVDRIGHRVGNKNSQGSRYRDSSRRHQPARRRCFDCGSFDHLAKDSTCSGITCFKCDKLGHINRDSNSKKSQSKRDSQSFSRKPRYNSSDSRRESSRSSSPGDTKSTPIKIVQTASKSGSSLLKSLHCTVGGSKVELLVDSGAVASILYYRTYKALRPTPRLGRSKTELTSYTGQAITVLGQAKASVICGNTRILDFDFVVVVKEDNLMGIDLLDALGFSLQLTTDRKTGNDETVHCS